MGACTLAMRLLLTIIAVSSSLVRLSDWTLNQRNAMLKVECNILRDSYRTFFGQIKNHWPLTDRDDRLVTYETPKSVCPTNRFPRHAGASFVASDVIVCLQPNELCQRQHHQWNSKNRIHSHESETNDSAVHRVLSFAQKLSRKAKRQRFSNFNFPTLRTRVCIRFPFLHSMLHADCLTAAYRLFGSFACVYVR